MRLWKWKQGYKFVSFLLLSVFFLTAGQVTARGAEYTYTVRLYAGNQGELLKGGIKCDSKSAKVSYGKDFQPEIRRYRVYPAAGGRGSYGQQILCEGRPQIRKG